MSESTSFTRRLQYAWNAFRNKDPSGAEAGLESYIGGDAVYSGSIYGRPGHVRLMYANADTLIAAIYNRLATDVALTRIRHVRVDESDGFIEEMDSGLNNCLSVEANVDQTGRMFIFDSVMSLLDEGHIACVPVDTTVSPYKSGSYDIQTMRVGKIIDWRTYTVLVELYNDRTGMKENVEVAKETTAILENPFYAVMNETNSTLRRLTHKLSLLDMIDDNNASGKLDLIIQLPYVIKSKARQEQAEDRRKLIEDQLVGSKYGVAYIDGTERIVQLNRPIENNLFEQVETLTTTLYGQLGITPEIMNGTADEATMLNYHKRTIDPILNCICDEFERKFLTKTARTQGQAIRYYRDPFSFTTSSAMADIADKFTRNEILSSNEVRGVIGFKPSDDPNANELRNKNLNRSDNMRPEEMLDEEPMAEDTGMSDENFKMEGEV